MKSKIIIDNLYPLVPREEQGAFAGDVDWKGKIIWMKPQEFLDLAYPLHYRDPNRISPLEAKIAAGTKMDPLVLITSHGEVVGHEGRHRAVASINLGIESVPVLVIPRDYPRVPKWKPEHHDKVEKHQFFRQKHE